MTMAETEIKASDDKESVMLVLMKLDGSPDLNRNNESPRSELVLILRIIISTQWDKCDNIMSSGNGIDRSDWLPV